MYYIVQFYHKWFFLLANKNTQSEMINNQHRRQFNVDASMNGQCRVPIDIFVIFDLIISVFMLSQLSNHEYFYKISISFG